MSKDHTGYINLNSAIMYQELFDTGIHFTEKELNLIILLVNEHTKKVMKKGKKSDFINDLIKKLKKEI